MTIEEMYELPSGMLTSDPVLAAEEWSTVFYVVKDMLARIRPVPEYLIKGVPVRDLDEILSACDEVLKIAN